MPTTNGNALTLLAATRAVFRTSHPTQEQVQRIYELMKAGAIPVHDYGMSPLKWTTTEDALAEFMAAQQMHKADARRRGAAPAVKQANETLARWKAIHREESQQMHSVYRHIWRDYFLAVMLRRRVTHRSNTFHRAVLAGQIVVLACVALLVIGTVRGVSSALQQTAEQAAVERWIDEHTDEFRVTRWHPPTAASDGNGVDVRVEYRYRQESPRWIQTDRTFRIVDDQVTELALDPD